VNFVLFRGYKTILPRRGAKKRNKRKVEEITAGCWEWECQKKLKR
jgi:hypothetical protein